MRLSSLTLMLLCLACFTSEHAKPELRDEQPLARLESQDAATPCKTFEVLDFGTKSASALRGFVHVADGEDHSPLPGATVAAREISKGRVVYSQSDSNGQYKIGELSPGQYEVWSCIDGFDMVIFTLVVDPEILEDRIDIVLSPSESAGVSKVVVQRSRAEPEPEGIK